MSTMRYLMLPFRVTKAHHQEKLPWPPALRMRKSRRGNHPITLTTLLLGDFGNFSMASFQSLASFHASAVPGDRPEGPESGG
jgi:hypothetical protein